MLFLYLLSHNFIKIISIPVEDGIMFYIKSLSEIMDETEYGGIRVTMEAMVDMI